MLEGFINLILKETLIFSKKIRHVILN